MDEVDDGSSLLELVVNAERVPVPEEVEVGGTLQAGDPNSSAGERDKGTDASRTHEVLLELKEDRDDEVADLVELELAELSLGTLQNKESGHLQD